jgi:hypothetical protein
MLNQIFVTNMEVGESYSSGRNTVMKKLLQKVHGGFTREGSINSEIPWYRLTFDDDETTPVNNSATDSYYHVPTKGGKSRRNRKSKKSRKSNRRKSNRRKSNRRKSNRR